MPPLLRGVGFRIVAAGASLLIACAGSPPAQTGRTLEPARAEGVPTSGPARGEGVPTSGPARGDRSGADTLLDLASQALERGDEVTAEGRYRRVLASRPDEAAALLGMGRIALARGDLGEARRFFEHALRVAPDSDLARVGLADVERAEGDLEAARRLLDEAVALSPGAFSAHARLADLTGRAPPGVGDDPLRTAARYPYDPAALVRAAAVLAEAGRREEAVAVLEKAVWLADLDPPAAQRALRRLAALDSTWSGRRVVLVYVLADETVRTGPAWRFRMREVWRWASASLDSLLATRFVPVALEPFHTVDLPATLDAAFERLLARPVRAPGIVAGFTARGPPRVPGRWRRGVARFLGRHLYVRLPAGKVRSRVLAHEILHLYGAVHVADDVESLMNPEGGALVLDAANGRIVSALRERRFTGLGLERDVLPWIDLEETIAAYEASLAVNLYFRNAGLADAMRRGRESRVSGRRQARRATRLDPHLADVGLFLARLLVADGRRVEAMMLLDLAAQLYGPRTARGQSAAAAARRLEAHLTPP
ncbi:MAG: tetratricopeptide repeat protein [Myxococcota bacterium]|nr:tetratricopeptide repeat protein [Myxococcota bacterium]